VDDEAVWIKKINGPEFCNRTVYCALLHKRQHYYFVTSGLPAALLPLDESNGDVHGAEG
jgi:hypothetical protein